MHGHEVHREQLRSAFNGMAATYDHEFESLEATKRIRSVTTDIFLRYFKPGSSLLELNCGTGTDAIMLARRGFRILATDVSPAMIHEVQKKVARYGLQERISAQVLPFEELSALKGQVFDGIYSNMGGLNCTHDLGRLASELHSLVKTGGHLIASVMTGFSLWETMSFLVRGNVRKAFRRLSRDAVTANLHGEPVQIYYYPPRTVAQSCSPYFSAVEIKGLNIFTPPPASQNAYRVLGNASHLLEKLDDGVAGMYPFNRIGDHYCIVLKALR